MIRTKSTNDKYIGLKIQITHCWVIGWKYNKLYPNTIHTIIKPRQGERNDETGVWVQGITEPVKVHTDEFKFFIERTKKKT